MSDLYFTQRKLHATNPPNPHLGADFWGAFLTYFERISRDNYFCKEFAGACQDGLPIYRNDDLIAARLREEIGNIKWPIDIDWPPTTEHIFNLLGFFYRYVAKLTKQEYHSYCDGLHPEEYDVPLGRYEYTVQINKMLQRFNHPYKLQKGIIKHLTSKILDSRVLSIELKSDDAHLLRLIERALDNFYDRSGDKKLDGLRNIVDAFERVKTLEGSNKKTSVKRVIANLSSVDEICSVFDDHLHKMTELANQYTIRHHESDKIVLDDEELIDFLFYGYYNLVRLILSKYGLVAHADE
jgi:hypothetical protein